MLGRDLSLDTVDDLAGTTVLPVKAEEVAVLSFIKQTHSQHRGYGVDIISMICPEELSWKVTGKLTRTPLSVDNSI